MHYLTQVFFVRFLFVGVICTTILSCEKDYPQVVTLDESLAVSSRNIGGNTTIGPKLTIPYKVEVMKQAYNNLHDPDISTLAPNYLYVRFLPQSPQDVKKLFESGFEFWDFPLDNEILSFGERYHDPSVLDSTLTWQYAVVPVNTPLPNVQHEVLESLALVPEDSPLAQEAFRLTGNAYDIPEIFVADPDLVGGTFGFIIAPSGDDGDPEPGGPGNGPKEKGTCECDLPDHTRKPSGCVSVFDNMLNKYEGVKELEVITAKTQIFGVVFNRKTHTDYGGCWMIDHKYHGKIHLWVRWENGRCDVKTMESKVDLLGYTFPRRAYIGFFWGPNYNNISIEFDHTTALNSFHFRNWVASTVNNSVYEFGGFTFSNGIFGSVPDNLKILITPWGDGNTGAAPMLDKLGLAQQFSVYQPANVMVGVLGVIMPALGAVLVPIALWLETAAPDIVYNINNNGDVNADDIRETMYHELAHAIHYEKVGNNYWRDNIVYVIENFGYGDGTEDGAGRCSVIESWGYQVGMNATHIRYGVNNSNINPIFFTWRSRLEQSVAWGNNNTHIPYGWEWDIQDNNNTNPPNEVESAAVDNSDMVSGFTHAQIFSKMTSAVVSMPILKTQLLQFLPSNVSEAQYNTLSAVYGF